VFVAPAVPEFVEPGDPEVRPAAARQQARGAGAASGQTQAIDPGRRAPRTKATPAGVRPALGSGIPAEPELVRRVSVPENVDLREPVAQSGGPGLGAMQVRLETAVRVLREAEESEEALTLGEMRDRLAREGIEVSDRTAGRILTEARNRLYAERELDDMLANG
jgi:hypothetical protein